MRLAYAHERIAYELMLAEDYLADAGRKEGTGISLDSRVFGLRVCDTVSGVLAISGQNGSSPPNPGLSEPVREVIELSVSDLLECFQDVWDFLSEAPTFPQATARLQEIKLAKAKGKGPRLLLGEHI